MKLCETCKQEVMDLLEKRKRRILAVGESDEYSNAVCFHLMELQRILEGKPTCGVYDDLSECAGGGAPR